MTNNIIATIGLHQYLLKDLNDADGLLNILRDAIEVTEKICPDGSGFALFYEDEPRKVSISLSHVDILKIPKPTETKDQPLKIAKSAS